MKFSAILVCLLSVVLLGCPEDSDSTSGDLSSGGETTESTAEVENEPVPPGQTEPQVPNGGEGESTDAPDSDAEGGNGAADVSLQELDWDGVLALVANHHGKVVVVDLWSLSCEPCLIEFPNLVTISRDHPDDVACISVATDYQGLASRPLSFYQPKVLEFLEGQDAQFENVLCTTPKPEFFTALMLGSEPAIFVFNQAGEQAALFTSLQEDGTEVSYERHVIPFVESLLAGGQ